MAEEKYVPEMWNSTQYGGALEKTNHTFTDASDVYANAGLEYVISFQHVPSKNNVLFKGFFTTFNETYTCDWASEQVYGRADPIYMFKQNQRRISLAFKVPAASSGEAYHNLGKIQKLAQFLYPSYVEIEKAQTITQSPLIRLKVMNLLQNMGDNGASNTTLATSKTTLLPTYGGTSDPNVGLLGVINNLTFNHNLETDVGVIEHDANTILPKMIEVNLDFSVIHEHALGWAPDASDELEFSNGNFPYGATLYEPQPPAPAVPAPTVTDTATIQTPETVADLQAVQRTALGPGSDELIASGMAEATATEPEGAQQECVGADIYQNLGESFDTSAFKSIYGSEITVQDKMVEQFTTYSRFGESQTQRDD